MSAYYNEIDPYCCRVLRKQIAAGNLPPGHVDERDIREVTADDVRGYDQVHLFAGIGGIPLGLRMAGVPDDFNIWTGGFPCQDISNAGKRAGIGGERSGLWGEYTRLVRVARPRLILVENVAALLGRGMGVVLGDLSASGYDAEWDCLPASAVGAPHQRDRLFVVAYPQRCQSGQRPHPDEIGRRAHHPEQVGLGGSRADLANAEGGGRHDASAPEAREHQGRQPARATGECGLAGSHLPHADRQSLAVGPCFGRDAREELTTLERSCRTGGGIWESEPGMGRVVDGVPHRVDRLRGLGNAVVPQQAQFIGTALLRALQHAEVA